MIGGFNGGDVRFRSLKREQWQKPTNDLALPAPADFLLVDGSDVWLGGSGYIAAYDLKQNRIRKTCSIQAATVDRLEVAGGYLWSQFEEHLYRVPLTRTR